MANYSEITYWLAFINESGLKLNLVKPIIQRWCIINKRPLTEIFTLSPLEWGTTFNLSDADIERVSTVPEKLNPQATKLAQWQAEGFEPIIYSDPRYPQRLLNTLAPAKQPLILWVQGNTTLLNTPGVTILGNDPVDKPTDQFLDDLLQTVVAKNISLISGYGRGLDRLAFEKLLKTETGQAIVVLPMGLSAFSKTTTKLNGAIKSGRIVLVSPFAPDTPFQESLAAARNLLIDHFAVALLVLQVDPLLRERSLAAIDRGLSVFVHSMTANGQALLEQGALPLTDAVEVVELVQQAVIDEAIQESEQNSADSPSAVQFNEANENYALHREELEPLEGEDVLKIISPTGKIPPALLKRLGITKNE